MENREQYYFLAISLPRLQIGIPPDIRFDEFHTLLIENLSEADYAKTREVRWFYDIENIRRYWLKEQLDNWGNLDENQLEEALLTREEGVLPKFVYDFLDNYPTLEERLRWFPMLLVKYYRYEAHTQTGFLKKYAQFERNLRLTLLAFRAKKLGRDLAKELQYEDSEDPLILQLLSQKDSKSFVPPYEFEDLKPLLEEFYDQPFGMQMALTQYRFDKIEEMVNFDEFSIDRILAYMVQYIMVDKWQLLDKQKGLEIVDTLVKEIS